VNRAKGGIEGVHPLHGPELRALRPLQGNSPYVFTTEAGTPVTTAWFLRMVQRTGEAAKLPFPVHPHMLRHSTGYKLANDGHDTRSLAHYLGHRNLQSTARYTALTPDRFCAFLAGLIQAGLTGTCLRIRHFNAEMPRVSTWLRQIHCEAFEIAKRAMDQGTIVGSTQDHPGRLVCIESFLPAGRT
jgi:Phage integrase family